MADRALKLPLVTNPKLFLGNYLWDSSILLFHCLGGNKQVYYESRIISLEMNVSYDTLNFGISGHLKIFNQ